MTLVLPSAGCQLVGWAGRATPDAASQAPRWLNSSAGDYRKSELLHGLHEGRERLAAGAIPVLCEGVLDAHAVTRVSRGAYTGLAAGGAALSTSHLAALQARSKVTSARLLVAFDAVVAGRAAAVAAYQLVPTAEYVTLPPGCDPAGTSDDVLRQALGDTRPLADLAIDNTLARWHDEEQTAETRVLALRDCAYLLTTSPGDIARQVVRVATALGVTFAEVSA